jgi:hypothetical protein
MNEKKARKRSPVYPVISLEEAISKVKELYNKEGKNLVSRDVAVKSMGYKSISGRTLQILSSLWQYKLIDRSTGMIRISDDAFTIIEAPDNTPDKNEAIVRAALAPIVFQEIRDQYPDHLPSDDNIGWFLKKEGFAGTAPKIIIQAFKDTISFAHIYEKDYNAGDKKEEPPIDVFKGFFEPVTGAKTPPKGQNMITDTFTLEEGRVTLQYPTELSPTSFDDLKSWTELQLRKIKRCVKGGNAQEEPKE